MASIATPTYGNSKNIEYSLTYLFTYFRFIYLFTYFLFTYLVTIYSFIYLFIYI